MKARFEVTPEDEGFYSIDVRGEDGESYFFSGVAELDLDEVMNDFLTENDHYELIQLVHNEERVLH